jgi:internalin A
MPNPPMTQEAQQAYSKALRSIEACRSMGKKGTVLFLTDPSLTQVPPEIGQLTALRMLYLSNNQLSSLPPEIGQLSAMTQLVLDNNQLTSLPPEIGRLSALMQLSLRKNKLQNLPPEISQMSALTELYLDNNQLTSLPSEIGQLSALTVLYLENNQLTNLPPEIGQLLALRELGLSHNQLVSLPSEIGNLKNLTRLNLKENALCSLPEILKELTKLVELTLQGNEELELPVEVLEPARNKSRLMILSAQPQEILDYYFRNSAAAVKRPILEAKVILVGWGAVGKTSLRRRLVDGSFNADEEGTHRIEITPWPVQVGQDAVKLHLWDFGGQEIMHATHQFFLTKRSLYVLVLAGREKVQGAQEAEYWLRLIASFGGESPVLVVLNKQEQCAFDLNRQSLMEKYPLIRGFVQTDCETKLGLEELEQKILAEVDKLPELRTEFDARWMAIKDEVTDLRQKGTRRLAVADYLTLCRKQQEEERKWQMWLLGFLHDLGVVVCFHEDARLANDGVLDPQWVVDGIYTILNEPRLKGGDGLITREQVRALLPVADYSDDDLRMLLEMMEKFELCFPPNGSRTALVVPELMTEQESPWKKHLPDLAECLRFELHYEFLPEGLLPRFIVATHDLSRAGERWRTGVMLRSGKNMVLVRGDSVARKVHVVVSGPVPTRRELLSVVRREFAKIHASISRLGVKEMVPVPGLDVEPLVYDDLLAYACAEREHLTVVVDGEPRDILIATLLDGIESKKERKTPVKKRGDGKTIIFEAGAEYHEHQKAMNIDHSIHIGGDNHGQVAQTMTNCTQMIKQQAPGELKLLLEKLEQEVKELLPQLPEEKREEAAGNLELLTKASTSVKPNRAWYSVSSEGLMEASSYAKDFAGNIPGTIGSLKNLLWPG